MNKPLVSIFCVSYNHEQFIAQALDGFIMQQTNFDFEIVISDDCSTDNTRAVIEKYKENYPTLFRDVSPKKNLGMKKNWIHTLSACTGKYIALCEGDDYWTDTLKLQKQVDFLEANEEYSLCVHNYVFYNQNEKVSTIPKKRNNYSFSLEDYLDKYYFPTGSILFKNFPINKKDLHNKGLNDIFLLALILETGKGFFMNESMSVYRIHEGGVYSMQKKACQLKYRYATGYYLFKRFSNNSKSIQQLYYNFLREYLEYAHSTKKIWLKIKITWRVLSLFPHKFNYWQKKEMIKKIIYER